MQRCVRWSSLESGGQEYLCLNREAARMLAESVVIGVEEGQSFGLRYQIECDERWRVRRVELSLVGERESLNLSSDGEGSWLDVEGKELSALSGCIDVDLTATPFTNTLPIRRLRLQAGESREVQVAYFRIPALSFEAVTQRYTCLQPNALYRFESVPDGFTAEIATDPEGLITHYPGLFERVE